MRCCGRRRGGREHQREPHNAIPSASRKDDPRYIVRLIARVLAVSVATVRLVERLAAEVALPIPAGVTAEVIADG